MRTIWMSLLAAALLSACAGSPPDEQAGAAVEDRKPGPVASGGAQSNAVQQGQVARVDLTGQKPPAGYSVLKDPKSILSKRSIYFELDSFTVKDEFKPMVEAHAQYLRGNPAAKMLMLLGAKEEQVEAVSLGEEKPKAQGSTDEAYSENRRDDILYQGEY